MSDVRNAEYLSEMLSSFVALGWSGNTEIAPRDFRFDLLLVRPDDLVVAVEVKRTLSPLHFSAIAEISSAAKMISRSPIGEAPPVPVLATTQGVPRPIELAANRAGVLVACTPDSPSEAAKEIVELVAARVPDHTQGRAAALPTKEEVVRLLAEGYPTQEQVARVIREAGLASVTVSDDLESEQRWGNALAEAENQAKVNALLERSVALATISSFRTMSAVASLAAMVIRYIAR